MLKKNKSQLELMKYLDIDQSIICKETLLKYSELKMIKLFKILRESGVKSRFSSIKIEILRSGRWYFSRQGWLINDYSYRKEKRIKNKSEFFGIPADLNRTPFYQISSSKVFFSLGFHSRYFFAEFLPYNEKYNYFDKNFKQSPKITNRKNSTSKHSFELKTKIEEMQTFLLSVRQKNNLTGVTNCLIDLMMSVDLSYNHFDNF